MGKAIILDPLAGAKDPCRANPWADWINEWSLGGPRIKQSLAHFALGSDLANARHCEPEIAAIKKELDDFKRQYEPLLKDLKAKHDRFEQNRIRIEGLMKAGKASRRSPARKGAKKRRPYKSLADFESIIRELD